MFDEMDRLRALDGLQRLLHHYQERAERDRAVWQDRVQEMTGLEPRELVKLHGELLAYGWVELNTGETSGAAPAHYRITAAGLRSLRQLQEDMETVG